MSFNNPDNSSGINDYLNSFLQNEDSMLASLYQDHYPATEKFVIQNNGSAEEAKDIYQEAFVVLWRNIHLKKFIPQNRQSFGAYLLRVSKNKWISRLRSAEKKYEGRLDTAIEETTFEEITEEQQTRLNEIVKSLQQMGGNCKEVLIAFYYKKMSMLKIAEKFGWTEATAKNNKYRCLEKLKILLKDQIT